MAIKSVCKKVDSKRSIYRQQSEQKLPFNREKPAAGPSFGGGFSYKESQGEDVKPSAAGHAPFSDAVPDLNS